MDYDVGAMQGKHFVEGVEILAIQNDRDYLEPRQVAHQLGQDFAELGFIAVHDYDVSAAAAEDVTADGGTQLSPGAEHQYRLAGENGPQNRFVQRYFDLRQHVGEVEGAERIRNSPERLALHVS